VRQRSLRFPSGAPYWFKLPQTEIRASKAAAKAAAFQKQSIEAEIAPFEKV
jgi:hypothetical protein